MTTCQVHCQLCSFVTKVPQCKLGSVAFRAIKDTVAVALDKVYLPFLFFSSFFFKKISLGVKKTCAAFVRKKLENKIVERRDG